MKFVESVRELILQALDEGVFPRYFAEVLHSIGILIVFFFWAVQGVPRWHFVYVLFLPVIVIGLNPVWRHLRSRRMRSWAMTTATVATSRIRHQGERGGRPVLDVSYVYFVSGERYGGLYSGGFSNDDEVNNFLERLKQGPFEVRYNPNDPRFSCFLREP